MGVNPTNQPIQQPLQTTIQTGNTNPVQEEVHISRELDGLNNTGIIGELLTIGTENLAQANQYFAMGKFRVSGLLAEDNQAVSTQAKVSKVEGENCDILCADDMYVAGDPGVGGKGNNYAWNEINVTPGYYTMFEDGAANGPKMTVNAHIDEINPQKDKAFTEYGFIVKDGAGQKTTATLSGGVLWITPSNGQAFKLIPPADYAIPSKNDPTARFYYADVPGAGKDGATEKRLMVDYYEKPSAAAVQELVARGMSQKEAQKLRSVTTMSYGFRTPDGVDTYASSEGVGSGAAMTTTANGVKTYYDSHYSEGKCQKVTICHNGPPPPCPPPPCDPPPPPCPPPPCPPPQPPCPPVAANERARIWGDPHIIEADSWNGNATAINYDFMEAGLFNVLRDRGIALNVKTEKHENATLITQSGLTIGNRTVLINKDGDVQVGYTAQGNGNTGIVPPKQLADGETMLLDMGYSIKREGTKIIVTSDDRGEYKIVFETDHSWKNFDYQNIDLYSKNGGVMSDGIAPSGLLGETFDADDDKRTGIEFDVADYAVDSLLERAQYTQPQQQNPGGWPPTGGGNWWNQWNTGNTGGNTGINPNGQAPNGIPGWTGNPITYIQQVITWLMQMLGVRQ